MAWLDLQRGILEEFVSRAAVVDPTLQVSRADEARARFSDPAERAWRAMRKQTRLRRRRIAEAARRPPCQNPCCGKPVLRLGTTGTLPKYCCKRCMQTAKRMRFKEAHRVEMKEAA